MYSFPPKGFLVNVLPSAWVDDQLITERKAALTTYLNTLLQDQEFQANPVLLKFLTSTSPALLGRGDSSVAIPLMVSENMVLNVETATTSVAATPIAASYYPDWSAGSCPPSELDFSKFDILFFGLTFLPSIYYSTT